MGKYVRVDLTARQGYPDSMNPYGLGVTVDKLEATRDLLTSAVRDTWNGDLDDALDAVAHASTSIESAMRSIVREMRANEWTWQQIGDQLGVSRQAVQERFGAGPSGSRS
jgi:DNA-directed RNA polymerase specialized sigma24 family protein